MKLTFKQYLEESAVIDKQIQNMAAKLMGVPEVETRSQIDDKLIDTARQIGHRFLETGLGKWVVSAFTHNGVLFARADPPIDGSKKSSLQRIFFVPKK